MVYPRVSATFDRRGNPLRGQELKVSLRQLTREAAAIDPHLAQRLRQIDRWVQNLQGGSIVAKKTVALFLLETIGDAQLSMALRSSDSSEERKQLLTYLTPTEVYWYETLFPRWFSQVDPKFITWRKKLKGQQFAATDAKILAAVSSAIEDRGGTALRRYVADFSLATDLIASRHQHHPLCVQLTTLSEKYLAQKTENWQKTLQAWDIDRGLFLSYNPSRAAPIERLVNIITYNSDNLPKGVYRTFDL